MAFAQARIMASVEKEQPITVRIQSISQLSLTHTGTFTELFAQHELFRCDQKA